MPLVIVPITTLATGQIKAENSGSASALFNMFRNLGGSIGIALLATQLDWREKLHSFRLGENLTAYNNVLTERLSSCASALFHRGTETITASQQAIKAIAASVRREAYVMAYADAFFTLGVLLVATILLVWLCRPTTGAAAGAH
jgi:DHA2 family multidrug resistance protein